MTEIETLAARIDGLEMRIAYQEQTIEELNATITDQWKLIAALEARIVRLGEQLRDVESSVGVAEAPEPPPPHY